MNYAKSKIGYLDKIRQVLDALEGNAIKLRGKTLFQKGFFQNQCAGCLT